MALVGADAQESCLLSAAQMPRNLLSLPVETLEGIALSVDNRPTLHSLSTTCHILWNVCRRVLFKQRVIIARPDEHIPFASGAEFLEEHRGLTHLTRRLIISGIDVVTQITRRQHPEIPILHVHILGRLLRAVPRVTTVVLRNLHWYPLPRPYTPSRGWLHDVGKSIDRVVLQGVCSPGGRRGALALALLGPATIIEISPCTWNQGNTSPTGQPAIPLPQNVILRGGLRTLPASADLEENTVQTLVIRESIGHSTDNYWLRGLLARMEGSLEKLSIWVDNYDSAFSISS